MSFRPRHEFIKKAIKDWRESRERYANEIKRMQNLVKLGDILPDVLIPGKVSTVFGLDVWLNVPYSLPWLKSFTADMIACGWKTEDATFMNSKTETARYWRFVLDGYEITVKMDASHEDSVCQLIEIGEREVVRTKKIYEIICAEGENALAGEVL